MRNGVSSAYSSLLPPEAVGGVTEKGPLPRNVNSALTRAGAWVTTWNYDIYRGWLTNKTYAGGAAGPLYGYTLAGRLASRTWARGTNTTYTYNNAGDPAGVAYNDGTTPALAFGYDRRGRQTGVTQGANATTALAYNDPNELLSETYGGSSPLTGLAVTNGYDAYLRRTSLTLQQSSTSLIQESFAYDAASRLQTVTDKTTATPYSAAYSYLANSPLVGQIVLANNGTNRMTTAKQYDFLNRLIQISSALSAAPALSYSYLYNLADQRIRTALGDGSSWLYTYDSLGQVIVGHKFFSDQTPVPGEQFNYTFDNIGNRTQTLAGGDQNGQNQRLASYTANNLNQYTQRTVPGYVDIMGLGFATNAVTVNSQTAWRKFEYFRQQLSVTNTSAPAWQSITNSQTGQSTVTGNLFVAQTPEAFAYDADGNLTSDGRWTYTWDAENRLVRMTNNTAVGPQQLITFVYDWRGRRIQKQVSASGTMTNNTTFVYDGWNPIAKLNATNSAVLQSYLWGQDLSGSMQGAGGAGGLLEISDAVNGVHFAAYDGNGNVAGLVKAVDGTSSAVYEYGPFGELIRATGPMAKANPFRFSTKYQDDETDLLYYGYRYYNPSTGRWINRDPLQEKASRHLYCFLSNRGLNGVDALGLEWGAWWEGFSESLSAQWASMGNALFDGLGGNAAVGSYYGVTLYAPEGMYEGSALGQAEAVGGFTQTATEGCIGTAVIATVAVSYLGAAEFAGAYGAGGGNLSIHAVAATEERTISTIAVRGAIRWGTRMANTGGTSSSFVRFTTTARYVLPVSASYGGRYLNGLPPESKEYLLNVIRNIWTGRIITTFPE
jgi:RHS repeat-associated protein